MAWIDLYGSLVLLWKFPSSCWAIQLTYLLKLITVAGNKHFIQAGWRRPVRAGGLCDGKQRASETIIPAIHGVFVRGQSIAVKKCVWYKKALRNQKL
jgi:hypothetical protein